MPISQQLAAEIERCGFFPQLLRKLAEQAIAESPLLAALVQPETTFDFEYVHRHVTILCLLPEVLAVIHVDEQDNRATASIEYVKLQTIGAVGVNYGIRQPSRGDGGEIDELTLQLTWGAVRRADTEIASCGDPQCQNDHGYTTTSVPDDLVIRVSSTAEGDNALHSAELFVAQLRKQMYPATPKSSDAFIAQK